MCPSALIPFTYCLSVLMHRGQLTDEPCVVAEELRGVKTVGGDVSAGNEYQ